MTEKELFMIEKMKYMQEKLDKSILTEHKCEYSLEKSRLALIDEIGETNHENKGSWCWWKYTQKPVDRIKLLEELADAWHFALSIDNHENGMLMNDRVYKFEVKKHSRFSLSALMAFVVLKVENIIPLMICMSNKLGYSIEEVYNAYVEKNKVNFERLENGY